MAELSAGHTVADLFKSLKNTFLGPKIFGVPVSFVAVAFLRCPKFK
jgi:hypothetical protein